MPQVIVTIIFICFFWGTSHSQKTDCQTDKMTDAQYRIFVDESIEEINGLVDVDLNQALAKVDEMLQHCYRKEDYCNKGSMLCYKANIYSFQNDIDNANLSLDEAEKIADKCSKPAYVKYKIVQARGFIASSIYDKIAQDSLNKKAIEIAIELNDTFMIASAYGNRASVLISEGRFNSALEMTLKSLDIMKSKNNVYFLFGTYANLVRIHYSLGNYNKAIEVGEACIHKYLSKGKDYNLASLQNLLGDVRLKQQENEKALQYFQEANTNAMSLSNIDEVFLSLLGMANSYKGLRNEDSTIYYYKKALGIAEKNKALGSQFSVLNEIVSYYIGVKKLKEAEQYFQLSTKLIGSGNVKTEMQYHKNELKMVLLRQGGKLLDAYLADELKMDSIENAKQIALNLDLMEKYESDKKQFEIEKLKDEKGSTEIIVRSQKSFIYVIILSLLLLSILTYFLYRQRQKQKVLTSEVTNQRDQIKLLNREINHRVKNNLAFMTSLLEMQARRTVNVETKQLLRESESRLKTLSLVHANLFNSESNADINLRLYLQELVENVKQLLVMHDKELLVITKWEDKVVDGEVAMRVGLIINELMTNSYKHAFGDILEPSITINGCVVDGKYVITYRDNGKIIEDMTENERTGMPLGMKLITLISQQIGDKVEFL